MPASREGRSLTFQEESPATMTQGEFPMGNFLRPRSGVLPEANLHPLDRNLASQKREEDEGDEDIRDRSRAASPVRNCADRLRAGARRPRSGDVSRPVRGAGRVARAGGADVAVAVTGAEACPSR